MQKNGARKQRSGDDANLLFPNFRMLTTLSSQLSVFSKLCIMNTLLNFLLLSCQSCRRLKNYPWWPYLRLEQKCLSRLAEYGVVIKGPPFLVLPRALPILNPPLVTAITLLRLGNLKMSSRLVGGQNSTPATTKLPHCSKRFGKPAVLHVTMTFLTNKIYAGYPKF